MLVSCILSFTFDRNCAANNLLWEQHTRYGNTLRFPRAAGEPPRAIALRGLTDAYPPAGQGTLRKGYIARRKSDFLFQGVSVYFLR